MWNFDVNVNCNCVVCKKCRLNVLGYSLVLLRFYSRSIVLYFDGVFYYLSIVHFISFECLIKECFDHLSGHLSYSITFHVLCVWGVIRYQVYQKLLRKRD